MSFSRSIDDRYFEDYLEGEVHRFGSVSVDSEEIVAFGTRFDPQAFHTDPEVARKTPFSGFDRERLAHCRADDATAR